MFVHLKTEESFVIFSSFDLIEFIIKFIIVDI